MKCGEFFKKNSDGFYVVFRVLIGFMFMVHGAQKFGLIGDGNIAGFAGAMGLSVFLAYLVGIAELFGGLGILLGVFTRLTAFFGGIIMIGAYIMVHLPTDWTLISGNGEIDLLYLAAFLVLLAYGNGVASLEKAVLKKELF